MTDVGGRTSNTSNDGTSPSGPMVSFMDLIDKRRTILPDSCGCTFCTVEYIHLSRA